MRSQKKPRAVPVPLLTIKDEATSEDSEEPSREVIPQVVVGAGGAGKKSTVFDKIAMVYSLENTIIVILFVLVLLFVILLVSQQRSTIPPDGAAATKEEEPESTRLEIIKPTPPEIIKQCNDIQTLVYADINEKLGREIKETVQTKEPVNVGRLFSSLQGDQIERYFGQLEKLKGYPECKPTFRLLRWIKGQEISGFVKDEYDITIELQDLITPITIALKEALAKYSERTLEIRVVGSTDATSVRADDPDTEEIEGIVLNEYYKVDGSEERFQLPKEIYYKNCVGDDWVHPLLNMLPTGIQMDAL